MSNKTTIKWANGKTITFNDKREVEGFTDLGTVYPSENSLANLYAKRKELGGGKQAYSFDQTLRGMEWFVDFDAKVQWCQDFR